MKRTYRIFRVFFLLFYLLQLLTPAAAMAADETWQLEGGGSVTIDPDTKRATLNRDGVATPMYDGTHRTQDGEVLIIRQGITTIPHVIPESPRPPEEVPAEQWEGAPIVGYSPCEKLVRRVCGKQDQCAQAGGCRLARQLLDMEDEERTTASSRSRMTFTSGQCMESGDDAELFPICDKH